jgi:hypothetical protein
MKPSISKLIHLLSMLAWVSGAQTAMAHCGGNHGPGHPHCGGGGQEDPTFTASSGNPYIPAVDSYSLDGDDKIVFRHAGMDLSGFVTSWPDGSACDHMFRTGTFTVQPKSRAPDIAVLSYSFLSELDSGASTMHYLVLEGVFDDPENWPPSDSDSVTTLTFESYELNAENKKARRSDCAGETVVFPDGPWSLTVTRQP